MFFLVIIGSFIIFDLLWWQWAHVRLRPLRNRRFWQTILAAFVVTMLGGFILLFVTRMLSIDLNLPTPLIAALYIWHLLILQVTVVLLIAVSVPPLLLRIAGGFRNLVFPPLAEPQPAPTPMASRRQVLQAAAVAIPPLCLAGAVTRSLAQLDDFRIRRLPVGLPNLPSALHGLTIAHVSDIHAGKFTRPHHLRQITAATNDLAADLVLITGDLIDSQIEVLDDVIQMVKRMQARHGVFVCEGNHDLFESRTGFELGLKAAGINLLVNETAPVRLNGQRLQVMGLGWGYPGTRRDALEYNLARLLPQRDPSAFPILLAHHPHAFDAAAEAGIPITLSGHTHGGQLMLSENVGAGPVMYKYWSGLYARGATRLTVSNGVGNWFPLRTRAPAEILHLTLYSV